MSELPLGWWAGVELSEAKGKNNGEVKGVRLFTCEDNHGVVVRPDDLKALSELDEM